MFSSKHLKIVLDGLRVKLVFHRTLIFSLLQVLSVYQ